MNIQKQRGQFFTTNREIQSLMGSLITHKAGTLLEPSAGAGHLVKWVEENTKLNIMAIEVDKTLKSISKTKIKNSDFFIFSTKNLNSFEVILGNPPYVMWKDMELESKESSKTVKTRYSDKTNLYYLFMDIAIDLLKEDGELIFITPKEWLYTSSAQPLREKMAKEGVITHIIDCGEEKLFLDASVPALIIFRFVKSKKNKSASLALTNWANLKDAKVGKYSKKQLLNKEGRFILLSPHLAKEIKDWGTFKQSYSVKVGMISGADDIYRKPEGVEIESESLKPYLTTKGVEEFIDLNDFNDWNQVPKNTARYLLSFKEDLLARKISLFTEENWWKYGAIRNKEYMLSDTPRFYVHGKTRNSKPFFKKSKVNMYSGGMLGIFKKKGGVSIDTTIQILNSKEYRDILDAMFLTTGNKLSLQPSTLEDAPFPLTEKVAKAWLLSHKI
jgi:adenine-specific DNA-methyltransferase